MFSLVFSSLNNSETVAIVEATFDKLGGIIIFVAVPLANVPNWSIDLKTSTSFDTLALFNNSIASLVPDAFKICDSLSASAAKIAACFLPSASRIEDCLNASASRILLF